MELTSYQAETVRFSASAGGYDPEQVERFQARVARVLADYERSLAAAKDRIERLERVIAERRITRGIADPEPAPARTADAAVPEALDADSIRSAALAEAEQIRERARADASSLRRAARVETEVMQRRLIQLRAAVSDIQKRMKDLADATQAEAIVLGERIDLEASEVHGLAASGSVEVPDPDPETQTESVIDLSETEPEQPTFYMRRLGGLRDRLRDVER